MAADRPRVRRIRAIDLSCRACGAMAMGAGLGFPVGVSAPLRIHPQPPTLQGCMDTANMEMRKVNWDEIEK